MQRTNQIAIDLIKKWESLHDGDLTKVGLQPKLCPANIWTVGYGHAVVDPLTCQFVNKDTPNGYKRACELFKDITIEQAEELIKDDLIKFEGYVNRRKLDINDNMFGALVSFTYNVGPTNFFRSNLLRDISVNSNPEGVVNVKDMTISAKKFLLEDGINEINIITSLFLRYIKANGKALRGLYNRRMDEAKLYVTNVNTKEYENNSSDTLISNDDELCQSKKN